MSAPSGFSSACANDAPILALLGDTPYDVSAAAKADVRSVALRCGGWRDEDLRDAIAIYDGPAALLAAFEESPLGAKGAFVRGRE